MKEPIAIVGMSCRFPHADTLQAFWKLLSEGRDTITEIPKSRWNNDDYYDSDPLAQGKSHQRHASMLENIHDFDPLFFNISPAEAAEMNPSQKLMLELVWEAVENSTIPVQSVQGKKVGVYVGNIWNDFEHLRKHKNAPATSHSAVGQSSNIIANRVSFAFGFTGPSLVMDTGCSSSLVALHLACQSLWDGSTEMSFAAGINHILDPDQNVLLAKFGGLSKKGKCSTFDEAADGFVRGEGAGVLFLKRLSDAERDGDTIYAVIKGSAMNNNGYNVNLPATSIEGQKQVLREAYAGSGIAPEDVHYVEAHGTGTKLGDPTETRALGEFFGQRRTTKLRVGSVKTNIGHLEAAAGMAGLIKVVLAIRHKMLPPSLNFKNPNPAIAFDELKIQVQNELGQWPTSNGEKLRAGINSFGWGGTNAHTVIEEYRPIVVQSMPTHRVTNRYALPLSARSQKALKLYAKEYADRIKAGNEEAFANLSVATALLKPGFDFRVLHTGTSKEAVLNSLDEFLKDDQELTPAAPLSAREKVVFVFPGQGSQWLGMGRELMQKETVFRQAIEACDKAFRPYTDWSLLEQLQSTDSNGRWNEINVIQPAICAIQIALAKLWMAWGVRPQAVVGHSMGEVAAAHIAGTISLEDAANIICTRSKLMKRVSGQGGAMAVTELDQNAAAEMIQRYPGLSVAVSNSPKSTVVAGDKQAIDQLLQELESKGLFGRLVKVDVASHSQQMDPLKEELRAALQGITPHEGGIALYSTVQARQMEGREMNAEYWVSNLRNTVQFSTIMQQLMDRQHVVFIEVSPHPVLTNAVNECAEAGKMKVITVPSLFREKPEQESLLKNLGDLYAKGFDVCWKDFYGIAKAPIVSLPAYPFQRETYALEDRSAEQRDKNTGLRFPLLGQSLTLAGLDEVRYWESQIGLGKYPYLADHQVNATPVFPGAGYVEIILEAALEIHGAGVPIIRKLNFIQSINLVEGELKRVQLRMVENENGRHDFKFFARGSADDKLGWTLLAEGALTMYTGSLTHTDRFINTTSSTASSVDTKEYYQSLQGLGLQYGKHFQGLQSLSMERRGANTYVSFEVQPEESIRQNASRYALHPALLDACFQPLFLTIAQQPDASSDRTTFLTSVDEVQLLGKIDYSQPVRGEARLYPARTDSERGTITVKADLILFGSQDNVVLKVSGLQGKILDADLIRRESEKIKSWLYDVEWNERAVVEKKNANPEIQTWLLFGDVYGLSCILLEKMEAAGIRFVHVTPDREFGRVEDGSGLLQYKLDYADKDGYARLAKDLAHHVPVLDGVLHMGGIYYPSSERELTSDEMEAEQVYGSISVLYALQEVMARQTSAAPKLAVVTNGMQVVGSDKHQPQVVHAALSGLLRVVSNELPQYEAKRYDLSFNPMMEELDQVVQLIKETDGNDREITLRGRVQFAPRLKALSNTATAAKALQARYSDQGTYLVTGFRGLGFVFIEWMIRRGARNFALLSRTGKAPDSVLTKILAYESQGCRFTTFQADASHADQLQNVLEEIQKSMPPLKGVIHAAGVIEAKSIDKISEIEFMETLAPKLKGAWNLHLLTQHLSLDCFVLFSSASSLIGLSGQASYVAANSFLDVLAHRRKQKGLTAQSINWGVIKDVGMVANESELEKYARAEGFEPIVMKEAMDVYDTIAGQDFTQIGIMKIDAVQMGSYYSAMARTNYFKGLLATDKSTDAEKEVSFLETFGRMTDAAERKEALEQLITRHVSKIIKMPAARINASMTFKGLGVDSLMAIQLRNLLEKSVDLKLSVAMFWSHPSIREYAIYLFDNLRPQTAEQRLIIALEQQDAAAEATVDNRWFVTTRVNDKAIRRLFCFHDAGGNASLYHDWENRLGDGVEVVLIELPGRGMRWAEQPYRKLEDLLKDMMPVLLTKMDKPFSIFGHSMGGLIAFEVIRSLRRMNKALPDKLFVSSTPSLFSYDKGQVDHQLSDADLAAMFPHVSIENSKDAELQQILMRILRADLELLNNYQYTTEEPLPVSIVGFHGKDDARVTRQQVEQWQNETTKSFQLVSRPGGHRYIEHEAVFVTATILNSIGDEEAVLSVNQPS